jgi:hypothetical protein
MTIMAFHASIFHFYYKLPLDWSIGDAIVFDCSFAFLAIGFWFAIRYMNIEQIGLWNQITCHVAAAVIFILIWIGSGYFLLDLLAPLDPVYVTFLQIALPGRIFYGLLYYCVIVLIYYLHIYYLSYNQKLIREAELNTLVKESELSLLKSQLNPHFIFNSLNSISSLTLSNPSLAQEMIIKLSSYIRYALKQEKNELVTFSEELDYTRLYLSIEKVRFGDKLDFHSTCPVATLSAKIPNMLVQPLLENAIKHGVYESVSPVKITLESYLDNNVLHLKLTNDVDPDCIPQKGTGIGIRHVQERLQLIYGKRDLLQIRKENHRFIAELTIPQ